MAYIGSGLSGQFGLSEEAVVGTVQAPDHFYEFESETLGGKKKVVQAEGIRGGNMYDRGAGRYVTQRWAEGDLNINFPIKKAGLLIRHMLGSPLLSPTVVSGAAFQGVHVPGSTLGKSLSLQKGVPPTSGLAPEPFSYPGSKITDWEISCAQSDLVKLKLTFDCMDELTLGTTPASPALGTPSYATGGFFTFVQGTLKQGGTVNTVSTPAPITPTQTAPATATTTGTLPTATQYFIKIAALNATGETIGSNELNITTGAGSTNTITANWSAVSNATQIKVYVGTSAGAENKYFLVAGGLTTLTITSLGAALTGTPLTTATAVATTVTTASGGTVLATIRAVKFGGKNGLKTDNYFLGSGTTKGEQNQNAYRQLTGSIDLEFISRATYDLYRADTASVLELSFVGANIPTTATPYSLDLVMPQVFIEDGISPNISGPDVIMMTAPLTATSNDADPVIQMTYVSDDTAL